MVDGRCKINQKILTLKHTFQFVMNGVYIMGEKRDNNGERRQNNADLLVCLSLILVCLCFI